MVRFTSALFSIRSFWILLASCGSDLCPANTYIDAQKILRECSFSQQDLQSIIAEAKVDQRGKNGRVRGKVMMMVQSPNRVRFDVMTQFGPVATFTADSGCFAFSDLRANRFYKGDTCPNNMERLLGMKMSAEEATQLLLGRASPIQHSAIRAKCESGGYYRILSSDSDNRVRQLSIKIEESDTGNGPKRQRLQLARDELFAPDGTPIRRVTFDDYRAVSRGKTSAIMPFSVRIEQSVIGADTLLRFNRIDINPPIPQTAFSQRPPSGSYQENLLCK